MSIEGYFRQFQEACRKGDIEDVFHRFAQMCVDDPLACSCDEADRRGPFGEPDGSGIHRHHREYNRQVWQTIVDNSLIGPLRSAIELDLKVEEDPRVPGFGETIRKEYGRKLLENFLTDTPIWA